MSTEMETLPTNNELLFLNRVGSLPIVTAALGQLAVLYGTTKDSNGLIRYTLETAESGVKTITEKAMPLVNKLEGPIGKIDSYACDQLDKLEDKYPIVAKPTEVWKGQGYSMYETNLKPHVDKVNSAKDYGVNRVISVKDYGTEKVNSVKTYTYDTIGSAQTYGCKTMETGINNVLHHPIGQAVLTRFDGALDIAETYVDHYLPATEEVPKTNGQEVAPVHRVQRLGHISGKVQRRMLVHARRNMQQMKDRSLETAQRLGVTVDLIQFAKDNMELAKGRMTGATDKLQYLWNEINRTEENADDLVASQQLTSDVTFEQRVIATARDLTLRLKGSLNLIQSSVSHLPNTLQSKLSDARQYLEGSYQTFDAASTFSDLQTKALVEAKERLVYVTEIVSFVSDKAFDMLGPVLAYRSVSPSSSNTKEEEMEMEEVSQVEANGITSPIAITSPTITPPTIAPPTTASVECLSEEEDEEEEEGDYDDISA